jgi:hypothetical protein
MREYRERDADNARWNGFEFRPGDIVIDAPSKSGTTWTQLLVALLVFDGPEFPEPIGKMSLWMEQRTRSVEEAHAAFAAQRHRRFIKSHTPLDGVPMVDDARYVCVGRDPRDAAVSMLHHSDNMDRERFAELIGKDNGDEPPQPAARLDIEEEFDRWITARGRLDWSARFLAHHYRTFWERRHLPNVALFHFEDYVRDLPGELRRLAAHLDIEISAERAAELAGEAALQRARDRAVEVAPDVHLGLWKDPARFFRTGASGEGAALMTPAQQEHYATLMAEMVPPDLARWMHRGRG